MMRATEEQGGNFNLNYVSLLYTCRILKNAWEDAKIQEQFHSLRARKGPV